MYQNEKEFTKTRKNLPNNHKNTKWPQNILNGRKIGQVDQHLHQHLRLQDHPKITQIKIFGLKTCHLATPA
jgi:hypothetical protein